MPGRRTPGATVVFAVALVGLAGPAASLERLDADPPLSCTVVSLDPQSCGFACQAGNHLRVEANGVNAVLNAFCDGVGVIFVCIVGGCVVSAPVPFNGPDEGGMCQIRSTGSAPLATITCFG